ncbi:MAG TPA: response regulator [Bryobacteraceae bacterium]
MLILLLISEPVLRTAMKGVLENAGYVVAARGNLGRAVDTMADTRIDLLITAPYVDNIPGHDAAKYLRGKDPRMAVLIVGGVLDDDRLTYRAAHEHFALFPPPFSAADLLKTVKEVMKAPQEPVSNTTTLA